MAHSDKPQLYYYLCSTYQICISIAPEYNDLQNKSALAVGQGVSANYRLQNIIKQS